MRRRDGPEAGVAEISIERQEFAAPTPESAHIIAGATCVTRNLAAIDLKAMLLSSAFSSAFSSALGP